jgi:hypothetical protein
MVRYLLATAIILLAGCVSTGIEIIDTNNHIDTPHYSIVVPQNQGWYQNNNEGDLDLSHFEKTVSSNIYIMRFSSNWVVDKSKKSWSAKQVADDYRDGEKRNMIIMGVMSGQYELKDVVMGEESIGNKQFYTMTHTAIANGIEQRASLYLHFPVERGFTRFLVALYSESYSVKAADRKSLKAEFLETLHSLKMPK